MLLLLMAQVMTGESRLLHLHHLEHHRRHWNQSAPKIQAAPLLLEGDLLRPRRRLVEAARMSQIQSRHTQSHLQGLPSEHHHRHDRHISSEHHLRSPMLASLLTSQSQIFPSGPEQPRTWQIRVHLHLPGHPRRQWRKKRMRTNRGLASRPRSKEKGSHLQHLPRHL